MKKKIFIIALAACLFALSIAGSSIAYFTDTEEYTNVFTAGDVNITLTYAGAATDEGVETDSVIELTNEKVYPGQNFDIDATVKNVGSEDAYVGAIITLKDTELASFVTAAGETDGYPVAVRDFIVDLVADDANFDVYIVESTGLLTIYVVKTSPIVKDESFVLFKDVTIPTSWDNDEMKAFSGLELNVVAYATQTGGMTNGALAALQTAFDAFDSIS